MLKTILDANKIKFKILIFTDIFLNKTIFF